MKKIGLTTTVPIEVLLAAGYKPVDLNNIFVTSGEHLKYIEMAERDGFPKSMCAWIKGIYGACISNGIDEIVGVVEGDCSNTSVLVEVLKKRGITVHPFSYPHSHRLEDLKRELDNFIKHFRVSIEKVEEIRESLNRVRGLAVELDELTHKEDKASGFENHLFQLCMSDFDGDVDSYTSMMEKKLSEIRSRERSPKKLRLAYLGVPPMPGELFDFVEMYEAKFVYNEVQREFAFPRGSQAKDIYTQYHDYTYPYDIWFRLGELKKQISDRKIDGVIHYTQAFCHKAVESIILKEELDVPILNIEGDKYTELDARTKLRLEAFLDMLGDLKGEIQ